MRVESLTFLRFVAAIIVVCLHFGRETSLPLWFGDIAISGAQMVTFFFVLSGFVMMISQHDKSDQAVADYYVSRLARIAPVYLLALAPFVLVYPDITGLFLSAIFMQAWFSPYPLQPNVPGWSLSAEVFFYLLFPWILQLIKRYRMSAALLLLLSLMVYGLTQAILSRLAQPDIYQGEPSLTHDLIFFFPLSHLCSFLLGLAGGQFFLENKAIFNSRNKTQLIACVSSLVIVYFALNHQPAIIHFFPFPVALGSSFFAPLFLLMILGVASSKNALTDGMAKRPLVFLGEISFSLYIIQLPVHTLCKILFSTYLDSQGTVFFLVYLSVLTAISAGVYRYFEMPCKRYLLQYYHSRTNGHRHARNLSASGHGQSALPASSLR